MLAYVESANIKFLCSGIIKRIWSLHFHSCSGINLILKTLGLEQMIMYV